MVGKPQTLAQLTLLSSEQTPAVFSSNFTVAILDIRSHRTSCVVKYILEENKYGQSNREENGPEIVRFRQKLNVLLHI